MAPTWLNGSDLCAPRIQPNLGLCILITSSIFSTLLSVRAPLPLPPCSYLTVNVMFPQYCQSTCACFTRGFLGTECLKLALLKLFQQSGSYLYAYGSMTAAQSKCEISMFSIQCTLPFFKALLLVLLYLLILE
jgi:hypothetical protein